MRYRWMTAMMVPAMAAITLTGNGETPILAQIPETEVRSTQWSGGAERNFLLMPEVSGALPKTWKPGKLIPKTREWDTATAKNIRWVQRLGDATYGAPVVHDGVVYVGTDNGAGWLAEKNDATIDMGVLLALDATTGQPLWVYTASKLDDRNADWPRTGICSTPIVETADGGSNTGGKTGPTTRLWFVTNRAELVCLETVTDGHPFYATGGETGNGVFIPNSPADAKAAVQWKVDLRETCGVRQRYMANCSPTICGDFLFVNTSNARSKSDETVPAPEAPSFIGMDKRTGEILWTNASPGENLLEGQWSSPALVVIDGDAQVIYAGGDGWVRSFDAIPFTPLPSGDGGMQRSVERWWFDANPKSAVWEALGRGDRNTLVASPVVAGGYVYVGTGQDPETGEGEADLWCIDPTGHGDRSTELVVNADGGVVPHRWKCAIDSTTGERVIPNPDSGVVWRYRGRVADGKNRGFEDTFHRTVSGPVVFNPDSSGMAPTGSDGDLLVIGDFAGLVHCLDARSGELRWVADLMSPVWGTPLVADGRIFFGTQDGDVVVFAASTECEELARIAMPPGCGISTSMTAANGVLYIPTTTHLFAIEQHTDTIAQEPLELQASDRSR